MKFNCTASYTVICVNSTRKNEVTRKYRALDAAAAAAAMARFVSNEAPGVITQVTISCSIDHDRGADPDPESIQIRSLPRAGAPPSLKR